MKNLRQDRGDSLHPEYRRSDFGKDNSNQITLRFWLGEFASIEERISNAVTVTNPLERAELQNLLLHHVRALRSRADEL